MGSRQMVKGIFFRGLFSISVCTFFITACNKDGRHKPLPAVSPTAGSPRGSAETYESIQPILQARCLRCHNAGPLNWGDPQTIQRVVRNGVLKEKIASGLMPQKGSPEAAAITPEERQRLLAWASAETGVAKPEVANRPASEIANAEGSANPDVVKDRNLAFVSKCMVCHGQFGTSVADVFPNLAGHGKAYILARVTEFLAPTSQGMMPDQIKQIMTDFGVKMKVSPEGSVEIPEEGLQLVNFAATYFSQFTPATTRAELTAAREGWTPDLKTKYEKGQKLFAERCVACHATAEFKPLDMAPNLFVQRTDYIAGRFKQFRSGSGGNIMPNMIKDLADEDLENLRHYVVNTHPTEVVP